jgi:hypothetical protein
MLVQKSFGDVLSQLLGWSYFLCWTVSFYPQVDPRVSRFNFRVILNFRRKSVVGLSVDFVVLNVSFSEGCLLTEDFGFYILFNLQPPLLFFERNSRRVSQAPPKFRQGSPRAGE